MYSIISSMYSINLTLSAIMNSTSGPLVSTRMSDGWKRSGNFRPMLSPSQELLPLIRVWLVTCLQTQRFHLGLVPHYPQLPQQPKKQTRNESRVIWCNWSHCCWDSRVLTLRCKMISKTLGPADLPPNTPLRIQAVRERWLGRLRFYRRQSECPQVGIHKARQSSAAL